MGEPEDTREYDELVERLTSELAAKYDPEKLVASLAKRARARGRVDPLDHAIRARYERRYGVDLSHVRVLSGEFAEGFTRARNAHAVTVGGTGTIIMGAASDKAHGAAHQALLGHELAHVAQATRGLQFKGGPEMPFAEEHEAEAELHEADILAEAEGADPAPARDATQTREGVKAKVAERVLEMYADALRFHEQRNGARRRI